MIVLIILIFIAIRRRDFQSPTPNGRYAYVPVTAVDGSTANFVYLMDTTNCKVVGTNIPVGNGPEFVAIAHNGKFAYVANEADGTVSVIQISPAQ